MEKEKAANEATELITNKGFDIQGSFRGPYLVKLKVNEKEYFLPVLVKYREDVPLSFLQQFTGEMFHAVNQWLNEKLPKKPSTINDFGKIKDIEEDFEGFKYELLGKDVFTRLVKIFGKTIKRDEKTKQHILVHGFSAYTPEPSNLELSAPTSEGKTYPVVEILKHFPKKDVWFLGGLSPTALAHDYGILVDEYGVSIEDELNRLYELYNAAKKKEEKWKIKQKINELLKNAIRLINLENKILVFLESPHPDTWARLRPILSHDVWEIEYKFTDRERKSGPLKTIRVKIRGWPVAISCTTGSDKKSRIWEEKQTRFTTISPEMSREKYKEAIEFTFMKRGLPQAVFDVKIGVKEFEWAEKAIRTVRKRLLEIKEKARRKFGTPDPNVFWIPFYEDIGKEFPSTVGRHMRDSQRFITTLQMSAAINVFSRPILEIDGG